MATRQQILAQLQARCVNGTGILVEFLEETKYVPGNQAQTNLGATVKKYHFVGLIPKGMVDARIEKISVYVQGESTPSESAWIDQKSLDGLFAGEVETWLDNQSLVLDYVVEKANTLAETATVLVCIETGTNPNTYAIQRKFVVKDAQAPGGFKFGNLTGNWNNA